MKKPVNYRPLLGFENAKTSKGEALGYRTGILYLAPADESGRINMCPMATDGCKSDCLFTAGRGSFQQVREARIRKTLFMLDSPDAFHESMCYDIEKLILQAKLADLIPAIRLNGTSDQAKLVRKYAKLFPTVQFYDYTKLEKPWLRTLPNYHLTFSRSENNLSACIDALRHNINIAVVFDTLKGQPLPTEFMGRQVIDGDLHDLRFLDPQGVIVGLRAKGQAKKDATSGFVQITRLTHVLAA